ncbi:hypothetical protein VMCG_02649 [Cytospora schulzeri]|uniref:Major facilitator superfamily (MFS) profile domain-containing protein n=1 Tax=Cytospora schulzeri TaxID=448051 RepID=A0A423X1P7_9PEZI|nr:hypothetical protein VMCG_02649 [Valsa malicola]
MRLSVRLDLEMSRSRASLASSHTQVDRLEQQQQQPPRLGNDGTLDVEKHAQSEADQKTEAPATANPDEKISKPVQTVKLVNPLDSGIYTLPLVLSLVASSVMNGIATQKIGYYVPSMLLSPSIMAIGEGLLSTLTRGAPQSHWVAFQFLAGFGLGMGMQSGSLACQTVLPMPDVPQGIALVFFTQQLGGAIFTTVGQTILSNLLVSKLAGIPGVDPTEVINNGATELTSIVPAQSIDLVVDAYDYALTRIFLCAMGLAFAALLSAAGMEWKNIKKGKPGMGGPGAVGKPGGPGVVAPGPVEPAVPPSTAMTSSGNTSGMLSSPATTSTTDVASHPRETEERHRAEDGERVGGEQKTDMAQEARDVENAESVRETEDGQREEAGTKLQDLTETGVEQHRR